MKIISDVSTSQARKITVFGFPIYERVGSIEVYFKLYCRVKPL